jgi:enoyl-CoA hydratase/carnithine racemase
MRFASREKAVISQWEIGGGLVPGGGPMARMPRLIGRGRALEMLLTGEDISGDLAERYGYVNRALPDAELDQFVDRLARRIARFESRPSPPSSAWSISRPCRPTSRSAPNGARFWTRRIGRRPSRTSSA